MDEHRCGDLRFKRFALAVVLAVPATIYLIQTEEGRNASSTIISAIAATEIVQDAQELFEDHYHYFDNDMEMPEP